MVGFRSRELAHTHTHRTQISKSQRQPANPISPGVALHSPCELDILVDRAGDYHGDDGIVPGAEEHESETQAHPQEGQGPVEMDRATERRRQ